MILSVIYVYYPMPTTTMKWSFVNDVTVVCIKIATAFLRYLVVHGFVGRVQFFDDRVAYFVRSKRFCCEYKSKESHRPCRLGGPMKCTASGTIWCHLTCALWLPELKFVDYTNMVDIFMTKKFATEEKNEHTFFLFRNLFYIWIKFHINVGRFAVLFVQQVKVRVYNVHIRIVERHFMYVFNQ